MYGWVSENFKAKTIPFVKNIYIKLFPNNVNFHLQDWRWFKTYIFLVQFQITGINLGPVFIKIALVNNWGSYEFRHILHFVDNCAPNSLRGIRHWCLSCFLPFIDSCYCSSSVKILIMTTQASQEDYLYIFPGTTDILWYIQVTLKKYYIF